MISNKEIESIMKTGKSLEESGLLIKGPGKIIENEAKKKQTGGFLGMVLSKLVY